MGFKQCYHRHPTKAQENNASSFKRGEEAKRSRVVRNKLRLTVFKDATAIVTFAG